MSTHVVINGERVAVDGTPSVGDLVAHQLGASAPDGRGVAVAVNSEVVPRGAWASTLVADGDHVEILNATQGG
ncbi:sulfur carrier protein ThiS [Phytoactinopolyspora limicola]|uniref:sulfur carrier protein ThiS n=1 Tax=Phytoactinopolyspora limicola TaxID=2715536 RepID=UPI001407DA83|nr:sulfur carrier protein ThiS [Phytoactinopolyspora limicola]